MEKDSGKKDITAWAEDNAGVSYDSAWRIKRKINQIPGTTMNIKGGIPVEGALVVGGTLIPFFAFWLVTRGFLERFIFGDLATGFVVVVALPTIIVFGLYSYFDMGGRPLKSHVASMVRYFLDDAWHKGGVPQAKGPDNSAELNYSRVWAVEPQFARLEDPDDLPATEFEHPTGTLEISAEPPLAMREERKRRIRLIEGEDDFEERIGVGVLR